MVYLWLFLFFINVGCTASDAGEGLPSVSSAGSASGGAAASAGAGSGSGVTASGEEDRPVFGRRYSEYERAAFRDIDERLRSNSFNCVLGYLSSEVSEEEVCAFARRWWDPLAVGDMPYGNKRCVPQSKKEEQVAFAETSTKKDYEFENAWSYESVIFDRRKSGLIGIPLLAEKELLVPLFDLSSDEIVPSWEMIVNMARFAFLTKRVSAFSYGDRRMVWVPGPESEYSKEVWWGVTFEVVGSRLKATMLLIKGRDNTWYQFDHAVAISGDVSGAGAASGEGEKEQPAPKFCDIFGTALFEGRYNAGGKLIPLPYLTEDVQKVLNYSDYKSYFAFEFSAESAFSPQWNLLTSAPTLHVVERLRSRLGWSMKKDDLAAIIRSDIDRFCYFYINKMSVVTRCIVPLSRQETCLTNNGFLILSCKESVQEDGVTHEFVTALERNDLDHNLFIQPFGEGRRLLVAKKLMQTSLEAAVGHEDEES